MATETRTITVSPEVDLEDVLEAADDAPVLLVRGDDTYTVSRLMHTEDEDIWANYDPEAARKALEESAGVWADLDTDQMIKDIYRAREEGSRPPDQPKWPT